MRKEHVIPAAYSLHPNTIRNIEKYALRETKGNKSKWLEENLQKIFAAKESERKKKNGKDISAGDSTHEEDV